MTDTSNLPKLPPGWEWQPTCLDDNAPRPTGPSSEWGRYPPNDFEAAATVAWRIWSQSSGVSQEIWEAMERDHRAMEALRAEVVPHNYRGSLFELVHDPMQGWQVGVGGPVLDDPADAILAALGEGVSDGE